MSYTLSAVVLVFIAMVLTARPAYAYIDPATGSMMLQVILAAVAAAAIALKTFWHSIRAFLGGRPADPDDGSDDES